MRREGRLHGYEFDREESHKRVKASSHPTNRSKTRPKFPEEKAARPRYKALNKTKGQRNKAHASDVTSNYKMHTWALRTGTATCLADSLEEPADMDPPLDEPLRVSLLATIEIRTHETQDKNNVDTEEEEDNNSNDSDDWLDLGSTDSSDVDDDDWYLC